jgi:mannose-6-phosphate isomerase-like protein (cupin superfamily)
MLIDFNSMDGQCIEGMNGGKGLMFSKMYNDDDCRIIWSRLEPGASIGRHLQKDSNDINFIVSGTGVAVCDGREEHLNPGVCHVCPSGKEHSIMNTGVEDLVLFTVVQKLR